MWGFRRGQPERDAGGQYQRNDRGQRSIRVRMKRTADESINTEATSAGRERPGDEPEQLQEDQKVSHTIEPKSA
jgi:hypothetical protein